jgi:hypothetical protein
MVLKTCDKIKAKNLIFKMKDINRTTVDSKKRKVLKEIREGGRARGARKN